MKKANERTNDPAVKAHNDRIDAARAARAQAEGRPEWVVTWSASLTGFPWQVCRRTYSPDGSQWQDTPAEGHAALEQALAARPYAMVDGDSYLAWQGAVRKLVEGRLV